MKGEWIVWVGRWVERNAKVSEGGREGGEGKMHGWMKWGGGRRDEVGWGGVEKVSVCFHA